MKDDFFKTLCDLIICKMASDKAPVVVGIDGMAASGKTSLAARLEKELSAAVIHADDYFLPAARKTAERLAIPGGNIDSERISEEIVLPLKSGKYPEVRRFDCPSQLLCDERKIIASPLIVFEGVYSTALCRRDIFSLCVFLKTEPELQRKRLLERGGEQLLERFVSEWLPLENAYFSAEETERRADLCFESR